VLVAEVPSELPELEAPRLRPDTKSVHERREQGISKAADKPARTLLVELAWCWLRCQPGSGLADGYRRTYGPQSTWVRNVGIVAPTRKLAVVLWRFRDRDDLPSNWWTPLIRS